MAAFLRKIKDDPLAHHVRMAVLRSLKRAVYSAKRTGHYGLAKQHYAHFTSPIRRYPDLEVHRQLAAALGDGSAREPGAARRRSAPRLQSVQSLEQTALHCSETEQKADEAERALLEIKKYRYLEEQIAGGRPETCEAVVVNVANFGMFVELIQLQVQGLVHVSAISDRFVRYDRRKGTLSDGKAVYKVGQKLLVRAVKVDFDKRRVDFVPAGRRGE
jgi:ribonuclease R